MSWKNYFCFDRRDRHAIILLLLLLLLGGVLYMFICGPGSTASIATNDPEYRRQLDSLQQKDTAVVFPSYYSKKLRLGETVDINQADTTLLKRIPGIGTAYSNRIVNYRNSLGGYASIEQLHEVWGLDEELFTKIKPYVVISGSPKKMDVNKLTFDQLKKHPYINYKQAKAIVSIRRQKGKLISIDHLRPSKEFSEQDIERLKAYLSFE